VRPRRPLSLEKVELELRCTGLPTFAQMPDAAVSTVQAVGGWNEIRARLPDGEARRVAGGVTLPGLLSLRTHLSRECRGAPVVGLEAVPVVFEDEEVTLGFRPPVVGTTEEAMDVVDDLLDSLFERLRDNGLDSRAVAERIASDRGQTVGDPVAVHDRLAQQPPP
jgi:hypothetical protein